MSKMLSRIPSPVRRCITYIQRNMIFKSLRQLRLRLKKLENLRDVAVPFGYQIRTYQRGDAEFWIKIIECCFGENLPKNKDQLLNGILGEKFDSNSLFFATYRDQPVGTALACQKSASKRRIGYFNLLGVMPQHRRKGLGRSLTLCALHYFRRRGFQEVVADTDDFRISAIKTYLSLGFEPVYVEPSHKWRWKAIFEKVKISC